MGFWNSVGNVLGLNDKKKLKNLVNKRMIINSQIKDIQLSMIGLDNSVLKQQAEFKINSISQRNDELDFTKKNFFTKNKFINELIYHHDSLEKELNGFIAELTQLQHKFKEFKLI
ncbi:hypothetical protein [Candidatus Phytoplasma meliae]|uniref:Uncharacterized protein n=1 Tax=Candidatus Phytoplasma meliae TaxID=1848402 RepID=A0ABS5CXN4_9MOLU|nr:hypothetical protein [Candidatus Phytoplasma meliae]MBP5835735.1 hypothetical protein [Candidatus Phytoplasma meliae]